MLCYSRDHLWLRRDLGVIRIGITRYLADSLTLVNLVDLPAVGTEVATGQQLVGIDAQKAFVEIASPVTLTIALVNTRLTREPWLVRTDSYGEGWLVGVTLCREDDWTTLLDESAYRAHVELERQGTRTSQSGLRSNLVPMCGAENAVTSCDLRILVGETAKSITSPNADVTPMLSSAGAASCRRVVAG